MASSVWRCATDYDRDVFGEDLVDAPLCLSVCPEIDCDPDVLETSVPLVVWGDEAFSVVSRVPSPAQLLSTKRVVVVCLLPAPDAADVADADYLVRVFNVLVGKLADMN